MLPGVTPVHKGLTPSGKNKIPFNLFISKIFAYLKYFSSLRMGVFMLMLGTHNNWTGKKTVKRKKN